MVYIGGNGFTDSIGQFVGNIDAKYLKIMGMFLVIISVICIITIIADMFRGRYVLNLSNITNAAMYISAFVAGFYIWSKV